MKKKFFLLFIFFTFIGFVFGCCSSALAKEAFTAEVTKIIDGDSLIARAGRKKYEIRLYGIDAPEYDQPYSDKAKKLVKNTILGRQVQVVPVEWDRYHRLVAIVYYDGESINQRLISSGLAWYYPKYCKIDICKTWKRSGKKAKNLRKNLWSDSSPMAPWKWKQNKYKRK
ncbi:MAG: micrococcal nuclease [Desulforhopalus sp.]|jgi:micrococcal nuclease